MDGTLAAFFFVAGLSDMTINHCGTGCFARTENVARLTVAAGPTLFQSKAKKSEIFLRYEFGRQFGPFQPVAAVSLSGDQDAWVGLGAAWKAETGARDQVFLELSFLPGIYAAGFGPDLGSAVQFRSAIAIGFQFDSGARIALSYDHRSNGGLASLNPGLETVGLRYSLPIR